MVIQCPHCGKQLKAGEKFIQTVQSLPEGDKAKVKCVRCGQPFGIDNTMLSGDDVKGKTGVKPPEPPDLGWLDSDIFAEEKDVEELPLVMILVKDEEKKTVISQAFEAIGYRVETAGSSREAIEKMQFVLYAAVVLDEDFEPGDLSQNPLHIFMSELNMSRRRQVLYMLVGKKFRTTYDLEALSYSANMVINEQELPKFSILLRKAVVDYESLFGPIIEELNVGGKA